MTFLFIFSGQTHDHSYLRLSQVSLRKYRVFIVPKQKHLFWNLYQHIKICQNLKIYSMILHCYCNCYFINCIALSTASVGPGIITFSCLMSLLMIIMPPLTLRFGAMLLCHILNDWGRGLIGLHKCLGRLNPSDKNGYSLYLSVFLMLWLIGVYIISSTVLT